MKESPYKVLDDILNCFKGENTNSVYEILDLTKEIGVVEDNFEDEDEYCIKHYRVELALIKLVKEGYLDYSTYQKESKDEQGYECLVKTKLYQLTFEGELLIFEGGYVRKKAIEQFRLQRVRALEDQTQGLNVKLVSLQGRMNRLTGWIVFGTVALVVLTFAYYLADIVLRLFLDK